MKAQTQLHITKRYNHVTEKKAGGVTYTPKNFADFVAKQIIEGLDETKLKGHLRILDPAVGDGELLVSLLEKLVTKSFTKIEVFGFDTNEKAVNLSTARLRQLFIGISVHISLGDFLGFAGRYLDASGKGDLFKAPAPEGFDIIIANPPYVRTQIMGASQAQMLAARFELSGRVDLYHAFILGMGRALNPGGIAGIIVSNRFMTTKSGSSVRRAILEQFNVRHVWDMGDTKLFEAAVLPAVLLLEGIDSDKGSVKENTRFTSIYTTAEPAKIFVTDPIAALNDRGTVEVVDGRRFLVQHGILDNGCQKDGVWRISTEIGDSWLSTVKSNTWGTFGDIGKIRVGVKTTADKVFIRSDWKSFPETEKPELLRPLITHHSARRYKNLQLENPWQIVYPHHVVQGKRSAVDLAVYPRTAAYFNQHRTALENREYVIEAGRNWYEIWVPQDPDAWTAPKIVFRDISEKPTFWMDLDGCVVNGDCYWLMCRNASQTDLLWLALAVGNSRFIEIFYDHSFQNKLYAGRRRFMTQYVEKFPLPDPDSPISKSIVEASKRVYAFTPSPEADDLEKELDRLVCEAFGLTAEEICR